MTAPLVAIMAMQSNDLPNADLVKEKRSTIKSIKAQKLKGKISKVEASLPSETLRVVQQTSKPGPSNWLSVLPLAEQGFVLNKQEFRDALSLRFNRPLQDLPSNCPCGQKFDINHAMNCKRGGFIIMRHNNLRDCEINLLSKVCKDVESELPLLPLGGENLPKSTIKGSKPDLISEQGDFGDLRKTTFLTCG